MLIYMEGTIVNVGLSRCSNVTALCWCNWEVLTFHLGLALQTSDLCVCTNNSDLRVIFDCWTLHIQLSDSVYVYNADWVATLVSTSYDGVYDTFEQQQYSTSFTTFAHLSVKKFWIMVGFSTMSKRMHCRWPFVHTVETKCLKQTISKFFHWAHTLPHKHISFWFRIFRDQKLAIHRPRCYCSCFNSPFAHGL